MDLIHWFLLGGVVAIVAYVAYCGILGIPPGYKPIVECGYSGAALVAGFHLIYCAFFPSSLVHLAAAKGKVVAIEDVVIQIGDHSLDLIVGSAVLILFAGGAIASCFRRATRKHDGRKK